MLTRPTCVSECPLTVHNSNFNLFQRSSPGLVFWFADADAASATQYPPTTFRWIDNEKEAQEAVDAAKRRAAKKLAEADSEAEGLKTSV